MDTLTNDQLAAALEPLHGWEAADGAIRRGWRFPSFRAAIDFIVRIADLAERADHHPTIRNTYDRVDLELTTHSAGGVTRKDIDLAGAIDAAV